MAASKRIVITGATGQIGRILSRRLIEAGHDVVVLSRNPARARETVPGAADYVAWEPAESGPWAAAIDGADGGTRESVWIRPARRHAPKRAGGRPRFLFGRLGHVCRGSLSERSQALAVVTGSRIRLMCNYRH